MKSPKFAKRGQKFFSKNKMKKVAFEDIRNDEGNSMLTSSSSSSSSSSYDDIISKAAVQDSRERRNSDRRRHRNGQSMCGASGINLNDKEVKDSIQDVNTTIRQIFTTNLETLNVIKKSVQEAYLHYYHNSNSSEKHCDSGKATSNSEGRQQVKDEYYYMNNQSKIMSLSTVNDDDDDDYDYDYDYNKSSSDLVEEKVTLHDNQNTSGLEFEEEQFEPVEFDVRRRLV